MSEYERNKGKLIPLSQQEFIDLVNENVKDFKNNPYTCKADKFLDHIIHDLEDYQYINGVVYKIVWEVRRDQDMDFIDVKVNDDGTVDFHTFHYNGGAHWSELIEWSLKKNEN